MAANIEKRRYLKQSCTHNAHGRKFIEYTSHSMGHSRSVPRSFNFADHVEAEHETEHLKFKKVEQSDDVIVSELTLTITPIVVPATARMTLAWSWTKV